MRIQQSLSNALLRRAALIPEQTLLGLALAGEPEFRSMDETWRNLELGREFCRVFHELVSVGDSYRPENEAAGTIASALQAFLSTEELRNWGETMSFIGSVLDRLIQERVAEPAQIRAASDRMQKFVSFAKQKAVITSGWEKP